MECGSGGYDPDYFKLYYNLIFILKKLFVYCE